MIENENAPGLAGHLPGNEGRRDSRFQSTTDSAGLQSLNERSEIQQPGPTGRQLTTVAILAQRAGPSRLAAAKRRLGFPAVPAAHLSRLQVGRLIAELKKAVEGRR